MNQEVQAEHIQRDKLLEQLSSCPAGIFNIVAFCIKAPTKSLYGDTVDQATKAIALIEWAENPDSPGIDIDKLNDCYLKAIGKKKVLDHTKFTISKKFLCQSFTATTITTGLIILMRMLGGLQSYELLAYDHFMRIRRNSEWADDKFLVISIDEEDIQYQDQDINLKYKPRQGSLSDKALLALLKKITPYKPKIIASDIIHDYKFEPELQEYLKINKNLKYISICQFRNENSNLSGIRPPNNFSPNQLGFINFPKDDDDVIRRQLLGMEEDAICPTQQSIGLRIALSYLGESGDMTPEGFVKIRDVVFKPLEHNAGGYQLPKGEEDVDQVLLNYQASNPKIKTLRDILADSSNSQLAGIINEKTIILIGFVDSKTDQHRTPYNKEMSGVIIHANMASQIINAVEKKRPLIKWLPEYAENIWIFFWVLLGCTLNLVWKHDYFKKLKITILLVSLYSAVLYVFCLLAFSVAVWIPFVPPLLALIITPVCLLLVQSIFRYK
ncbi:MAG: CHASE2 domain-containing protein [Gloeotrichia echinulata CP02]|jgi:CHASE2 domain-containing sensor protein